jgi:hypothetical protein
MPMKGLLLLVVIFAGCELHRAPTLLEEVEAKYMADRMMASFEVRHLQTKYQVMNDYVKTNLPHSYPAVVAGYIFLDLSIEGIRAAIKDPDNVSTLPVPFPDRVQPKYDEGREYLAFMKSQMMNWAEKEVSWQEADYRVIAKGNETNRRFKEEFASKGRQQELEKQTRALEALSRQRPILIVPP